jgi:hypothetical protein
MGRVSGKNIGRDGNLLKKKEEGPGMNEEKEMRGPRN